MRRNSSLTARTETRSVVAASPTLTPVLNERFVLRWPHAVICGGFCLLFLYLSYIPLFHTETWRHAYFGRHILATATLPATDPALPLADGMPQVTTTWLSQVVMAVCEKYCGAEGLTYLLATSQITSLILLALTFHRLTRHLPMMVIAVSYVILMWWGQLGILRPQVLGVVCLSALLLLLTFTQRRQIPAWLWIAIPVLMMLWANLDGSFVFGAAILLSWCCGSAVDLVRRSHSLSALLNSRSLRKTIYLSELGLLATLINPLGIDLWSHAIQWDNNPLWLAAGGWRPLTLAGWTGCGFLGFWVAVLFLVRRISQPIRTATVFLLAIGTLAMMGNELLALQFAPIALFATLPYCKKFAKPRVVVMPKELRPVHFMYTLICGFCIWAAFALSPISNPLLGGKARANEQLHDSQTPLGASQHLKESPAESLIWAPYYWGDWLAWDATQTRQVAVNSQMHLLPEQVRKDYDRVYRGEAGWERVLDRYAAKVLVVDKQRQQQLVKQIDKKVKGWTVTFEDDAALILRRQANDGGEGKQT